MFESRWIRCVRVDLVVDLEIGRDLVPFPLPHSAGSVMTAATTGTAGTNTSGLPTDHAAVDSLPPNIRSRSIEAKTSTFHGRQRGSTPRSELPLAPTAARQPRLVRRRRCTRASPRARGSHESSWSYPCRHNQGKSLLRSLRCPILRSTGFDTVISDRPYWLRMQPCPLHWRSR